MSAAAMATTKRAIVIAVACLAVGAAAVAGAATAAAGSADPSNWGRRVVDRVAACKAARTPAMRGIGECVSDFASGHGQQVSSANLAAASADNPRRHSPGQSSGLTSGKAHGGGRRGSHRGKS
jgi:hypothetical protein